MVQLRNLCRVSGSSLLESVMALSIISICLYIAILVFASVFTPKTSAKAYGSNNKVNEAFFIVQIMSDTLTDKIDNENWTIEEDDEGACKKVNITYQDSLKLNTNRTFYIASE